MPSDPDSILILTVRTHFCVPGALRLLRRGRGRRGFSLSGQVKREAEEGDPKAKKLLKLIDWQKAASPPCKRDCCSLAFWGWGFALYSFGWMLEKGPFPMEPETLRVLLADVIVTAAYLLVFFLFGDLLPKKSARHSAKAFASALRNCCARCSLWRFPF